MTDILAGARLSNLLTGAGFQMLVLGIRSDNCERLRVQTHLNPIT